MINYIFIVWNILVAIFWTWLYYQSVEGKNPERVRNWAEWAFIFATADAVLRAGQFAGLL